MGREQIEHVEPAGTFTHDGYEVLMFQSPGILSFAAEIWKDDEHVLSAATHDVEMLKALIEAYDKGYQHGQRAKFDDEMLDEIKRLNVLLSQKSQEEHHKEKPEGAELRQLNDALDSKR